MKMTRTKHYNEQNCSELEKSTTQIENSYNEIKISR